MERQAELKAYIRSLCIIYYNKAGAFYKDSSIRTLIDKAKKELK